jgi:hypothetical protein
MLRVPSLLATVTILASATPVAAQQSAPPIEIRAGSRVRLDAPGYVADRTVALVVGRTEDTLTVAGPNAPSIAVPVSRIAHLEVSRGDSRSAGAIHGMKWGVPIGLGFGALATVLSDNCKTCTEQPNRAALIPAFTGAGAFWGAIIGAVVGHEQWAPLALSPRTSFDTGTQRATLAFSARF